MKKQEEEEKLARKALDSNVLEHGEWKAMEGEFLFVNKGEVGSHNLMNLGG